MNPPVSNPLNTPTRKVYINWAALDEIEDHLEIGTIKRLTGGDSIRVPFNQYKIESKDDSKGN
jgi:hypothetical protein